MAENKERALSDHELGNVSGGTRTIRDMLFFGHVGKYDGVVGQNYYVVFDDINEWYYGTMLKTWEKDGLFGETERTHRFRLILNNGYNVVSYGLERNFSGDVVSLYTGMENH